MPEGKKYDKEKCRMELFPADAYEEICNILTFGSKKYGDYNWLGADKNGKYDPEGKDALKYSRIIGALKRHLISREKGNILDEESGFYTMAHVAVNAIFLLVYDMRGFHLNNDIVPITLSNDSVIDDKDNISSEPKVLNEDKDVEVSVVDNNIDDDIDKEVREYIEGLKNMEIPFDKLFEEMEPPEYFESDLLADDEKDPDGMAYFYFDKEDGSIRCIDMNSSHYDECVKNNPVGMVMKRDEYRNRFSELFKINFVENLVKNNEQENDDGEKKED